MRPNIAGVALPLKQVTRIPALNRTGSVSRTCCFNKTGSHRLAAKGGEDLQTSFGTPEGPGALRLGSTHNLLYIKQRWKLLKLVASGGELRKHLGGSKRGGSLLKGWRRQSDDHEPFAAPERFLRRCHLGP